MIQHKNWEVRKDNAKKAHRMLPPKIRWVAKKQEKYTLQGRAILHQAPGLLLASEQEGNFCLWTLVDQAEDLKTSERERRERSMAKSFGFDGCNMAINKPFQEMSASARSGDEMPRSRLGRKYF